MEKNKLGVGSYQNAASDEHQNAVEFSAKFFNGEMTVIRGNSKIKGKYCPDIKTVDTDIEVEMMPKAYLKKKIDKWDRLRKKILILGFSKQVDDNFQEVYAINRKNELTRLK